MRENKKSKAKAQPLPVIRTHVAGMDLGSREHWVCGPARGDGNPNVRVFGTTTPRLNELVDWLLEQEVDSVAMESTGVYWIPVYELLESRGIEVVLVNARELKSVPGRKTDMKDCQWIQRLHSCGLLRGSFRPDEAICALRAIHRQWENLIAERTKAVQWMQKALDQMNIQVHRAVTDITGTTGMAIVRAIVAGERNPQTLARFRDERCKKSLDEIAEHLTGTWRQEHLFNLEMAVSFYDSIQAMIDTYEARLYKEIEVLQPPDRKDQPPPSHPNPAKEKAIRGRGEQKARKTLWRFSGVDLTRIDGISTGSAKVILTEVGTDLSAFPSEKDFVSWLRLCPRTPISGGKPLSKKRKGMGATRVAGVLRMAALSLSRSKTALGAYFRRVARKNDGAVAVFATARKLATYIYRMLRYGHDYVDIGEQAYEAQFRIRRIQSLKASAESLGYTLVPDVVRR
jgi:transposase